MAATLPRYHYIISKFVSPTPTKAHSSSPIIFTVPPFVSSFLRLTNALQIYGPSLRHLYWRVRGYGAHTERGAGEGQGGRGDRGRIKAVSFLGFLTGGLRRSRERARRRGRFEGERCGRWRKEGLAPEHGQNVFMR